MVQFENVTLDLGLIQMHKPAKHVMILEHIAMLQFVPHALMQILRQMGKLVNVMMVGFLTQNLRIEVNERQPEQNALQQPAQNVKIALPYQSEHYEVVHQGSTPIQIR